MKRLLAFLIMMAGGVASYAQNDDQNTMQGNSGEMRTLFSNNNSLGGYGAIAIRYSEINNRDAFIFGARGGVLMAHMFALGVAGNGFFNDMKFNSVTGTNIRLAGGYGGFFFEPVLMPGLPVHVSFPVMIGAGGVGVMTGNDNNWGNRFKSEASDAFMVIEPGIELELSITRFFRFCIGGYYRYTTDIEIEDPEFTVPSDILRGISGGVTFKFGRF